MKNLLEKIIKSVLFEQTGVGKIQRMALSQSEMQDAKASGAVFAYKVITRNAKTERARLDLVRAATMASVNSGDGRTAVGAESKFANGKYVYVIDPAVGDGRRQVSLVRIFPELTRKDTATSDTEDPNSITVQTIVNYIGRSRIMSLQGWQIEQRQQGETTTTPMETDANVLDRVATAAGDVVDKVTGKDAGKPEYPTSSTENNPVENTYPRDVEGVKVYTMADTDDYVYAKINGTWKYADKKTFEADPKLQVFTKKLNKAGIANIEAKFDLATSNQNQDQGTQDQNSGGDPIPPKPEQPQELKPGSKVQFKEKVGTKIPVYQWFNKESKFKQVDTYTIEKDLKDLTFEKKSRDNKYALIKWPAGQKFWIAAKHLQQFGQIQGQTDQVGDTVTGLQVTVNGKTRDPKKGDMIRVPSTKLYSYNADAKKFYPSNKTWTDNGKSKMFITQSSNKQWIFVNFGSGDKYWVPASIFKK